MPNLPAVRSLLGIEPGAGRRVLPVLVMAGVLVWIAIGQSLVGNIVVDVAIVASALLFGISLALWAFGNPFNDD